MARNMAKRFANMTLLYWAPITDGSGMRYDEPVEFKGKFIGNSQLGEGGPGDFAFAGGGQRDNLVLFYLLEPAVDGYVSWSDTRTTLGDEGLLGMHPSEVRGTHKIKAVNSYVMPRAKTAALADMAFIAQTQ